MNKSLTNQQDSLPNFVSIGNGRAGTAGFFPGQWAALPVKDPNKGIDYAKRKKTVGEQSFGNRLDILNALNADFQKNFGDRDTQSYMDTYAGALKFMNPKISMLGWRENANIKNYTIRVPLVVVAFWHSSVERVKFAATWRLYSTMNLWPNACNAKNLDSGLSALLTHLSQKGLLDSTLVVVSTEFGRKPDVNPNAGRDHHPDGFTCLMAGAGVKAGQIYGATTNDGKHADEGVLDVTDFNASIAWRLGIDPGLTADSASGRPFELANKGKVRAELFL